MHGRGIEPLCLAAAEPKADPEGIENTNARISSRSVTPSKLDETPAGGSVGQSRGSQGPKAEPAPPNDPVEAALTAAIEGATRAGEWGVVGQLARELEARRAAPSTNPRALSLLRGTSARLRRS